MSEFEDLFRKFTPTIYRFLYARCGDKDLSEELTSETLYQAYLHIDQFRGECKIETWLCQIAKNALYKEQKRRDRNLQLQDNLSQSIIAEDVHLEKIFDRAQALEVHKHLHMLSEPYREVFMLRIFGELEFKEIAEVCKKSDSWAKATFYRAKEKLVKSMEENK